MIDWGRTKAYYITTGSCWGIRINLVGRELKGIVPREEYDAVRNRIIEELNLAVDEEEEGRRVMEGVYRREDIYQGPHVENAPDVILIPHCEYYLKEQIRDNIFKEIKGGGSNHRSEGILILRGPGIKKGRKIEGAHILDVAPTILYLLGLPIPKGFDGKVLTEALEPDVLKVSPVRVEDIPLEVKVREFVMDEAENEGVRKMLRGLGYIE